MDMYRILENFDAVNGKQTLVEGQMKRQLEDRAEHMSKEDFVASAGEYGMSTKEATEFWIAVNGDDEELDEERRSEEDWDAQALVQQKAKLAREKNKMDMQRRMQNPEKYAKDNIDEAEVAGQFKPGDRVMYMNTFATVVAQDGDAYGIRVDGKPGTMMVPVGQIKKPSYDESVAEGDMEESALQAYLGKKKYGPEGMKALQQAGREGASKEKMAKIRASHDKMDEADMEEGNKFAHNVLKAKAAGMKKADLDGDGDMETVREVFPGTTEYELRFGKDDAASAFDKKKISTGTVYSRRYKDEPESDDDTPKSAGRPKGTGRKLGAKGPSVASKLLKGKGGLKEGDIDIVDRGEYDREGDMAINQVHQIADAARELHAILASDDNLPEWVQSKITKALDYIDTARDYLGAEGEMDREELPEIAPVVGALVGRTLAGAAGAGSTGQAIGSLAGRAVAGAMNGNDEVEEAGYSAKSARAGKDIGKPGKNFSKIAKGAAERYGSKEAGERVAGAVLKKLRAKEGAESSDKKDVPFDGPYRTKGDDKDQFGNKIKHAARHAARQGLADMTTAELKAELKRRSQVEEESTETKDQHAEKAGKKVTKDLEYDMKHKGKDDAKAEKAGKKVTKDIEYDDKKDKKKEVEETTVSGSVAPAAGGDAPKKGKGGMQFGKGVYEGQVAESFETQLKNVLNEGMSVNVSTDDTGKKSISVNATDSDADALGDMLKMAGLFSSEGYSRTCESCHGIHEAGACGADMVEEELANSPDEVYADADYMTQTLSGGLNGPKTTGQTTGAVVNRQDSRQGVMAEAERVKEQAESRLWNLYKKI
jgi:hypothetical protein